jgi:hypothetical protein
MCSVPLRIRNQTVAYQDLCATDFCSCFLEHCDTPGGSTVQWRGYVCACDQNVFLSEMIVVVTLLGGVQIWRYIGLIFSSLKLPKLRRRVESGARRLREVWLVFRGGRGLCMRRTSALWQKAVNAVNEKCQTWWRCLTSSH